MRLRGIAANMLLALVSTLVFLSLAETLLRLVFRPAAAGPQAGWVSERYFDDISQVQQDEFEPDPLLLWRLDSRRFAAGNGFRTPPFSTRKPAGVLRAVCLGDSNTYGLHIGEPYPRLLEKLLNERGDGRWEVINLGVPGYSSLQGLELLNTVGLALSPDLVTIAFGFNDTWPSSISDRERFSRRFGWANHTLRLLYRLETVRRLRSLLSGILRRREEADYRRKAAGFQPRVSPDEYLRCVTTMVEAARDTGAGVILVNLNLANPRSDLPLRRAAADLNVPLLEVRRLLFEREIHYSLVLEQKLGIARDYENTSQPGMVEVIFRLLNPEEEAAPLHWATVTDATRPSGPGGEIPLLDDGQGRDVRAGDGVFTGGGLWPRQSFLRFTYRSPGGRERLPAFPTVISDRAVDLGWSPSDPIVLPLHKFGSYAFMLERVHPDSLGHRFIAERLAELVRETAGPSAAKP